MWFELWLSLWLANELLKTLRAALKYLREAAKMAGERRLSRTSGMTNSIKKVSRNVVTMRQLSRGGTASASAGTALRCVAMQCSRNTQQKTQLQIQMKRELELEMELNVRSAASLIISGKEGERARRGCRRKRRR